MSALVIYLFACLLFWIAIEARALRGRRGGLSDPELSNAPVEEADPSVGLTALGWVMCCITFGAPAIWVAIRLLEGTYLDGGMAYLCSSIILGALVGLIISFRIRKSEPLAALLLRRPDTRIRMGRNLIGVALTMLTLGCLTLVAALLGLLE